jgi:lipoprotein
MFKIRKGMFLVIICMFTCCTVLSSCSFINKEETEQSSVRKSKKKSKKKKKNKKDKDKKDKDKKETKESENEAKKSDLKVSISDNASEKERLKNNLAETLDAFLSSSYTVLVVDVDGMDEEYSLIETKINYDKNTLYFVSLDHSDEDYPITIITDGEVAYETNEDNTAWERYDYHVDYVDAPMIGASYISSISFIYAALDANLYCEYYPEENSYYIEAYKEEVEELDFKAINSKIKNADKLDLYDELLLENENNIKMDYSEYDIFKRDYIFSVEDNSFFIFETLSDESGEVVEHSSIVKLKEGASDIEDKNKLINIFKNLKEKDDDYEEDTDTYSDFKFLKY